MAKVLKNQLIEFNRSHPKRLKPKGIDNSSVPEPSSLTATKKMNKTASSASLKLSGFFSQKNQVSFKGKNDILHKLGKTLWAKKIARSDTLHRTLKTFDNLGFWETVAVFAISVSIKPLSLLKVPGAKEEDKKYAATKAILAGAVDFGLSTAVLIPIKRYFDRLNKKMKANPELVKKEVAQFVGKNSKKELIINKKAFKVFKTMVSYTPKFLMLPVRAGATIALIPPTLKLLFPDEGKNLKPSKREYRRMRTPINFSNSMYGTKKNDKIFHTFTGGMYENN